MQLFTLVSKMIRSGDRPCQLLTTSLMAKIPIHVPIVWMNSRVGRVPNIPCSKGRGALGHGKKDCICFCLKGSHLATAPSLHITVQLGTSAAR